MKLPLIAIAFMIGIILGLYFKISIVLFLICLIMSYFVKSKTIKKYFIIFIISLIVSSSLIQLLEIRYNYKSKIIQEDVSLIRNHSFRT